MGLFSWLTERGKSVYSYILRGVREKASGTSILRHLRKFGLGYRTQDFFRDWNETKYWYEKSQHIRYVPRSKVPSEDVYVPVYSHADNKYLTTMRVRGINRVTGEEEEIYFKVGHNFRISREDLENIASDKVSYKYSVTDVTPVMGELNLNYEMI